MTYPRTANNEKELTVSRGEFLEVREYIIKIAESKQKRGVWDPMPELSITSPYVHSRVDSNTFTMGIPMPESTLSPSQGLWIWPQEFGFVS